MTCAFNISMISPFQWKRESTSFFGCVVTKQWCCVLGLKLDYEETLRSAPYWVHVSIFRWWSQVMPKEVWCLNRDRTVTFVRICGVPFLRSYMMFLFFAFLHRQFFLRVEQLLADACSLYLPLHVTFKGALRWSTPINYFWEIDSHWSIVTVSGGRTSSGVSAFSPLSKV